MQAATTGISQSTGSRAMPIDPLKNFQSSFQQISDEFARLTSATEALRAEQAHLSATHAAQKAALSTEITALSTQRDNLQAELAEGRNADEWWRKKEEALPRRNNSDETGRATRAAYLANEKARMLEEQLAGLDVAHEEAMEIERSVAAGLRDRIGRMEGRIRALQNDVDVAREGQEETVKTLKEADEKYERENGKWCAEVQDLKAALREERRLKREKEEEIDRLTEALRDAVEDARRIKSASVVDPSASRALTPLQLNIPGPQTPPRPSSTQTFSLKSPTSIPQTPRSLGKAYAYLDKRHTEAQAQNRLLETSLQKAQTALKDLQEKHKADLDKFLEWRKFEDARSAVRKRKREEKRRGRDESMVGDGGGSKKRRSGVGREEGILVQDSEESAPLSQDMAQAEGTGGDSGANTSQTVEDDHRDGSGGAGQAMEVDGQLEESQEYCSPEDLRTPSQIPTTQRQQSLSTSISHRLDTSASAQTPHRNIPLETAASASQAQDRSTSQHGSRAEGLLASQAQRVRTGIPRPTSPYVPQGAPTSASSAKTSRKINNSPYLVGPAWQSQSSSRPTTAGSKTSRKGNVSPFLDGPVGQSRPSSRPISADRIPASLTLNRPVSPAKATQPALASVSRRSVSPNKTPAQPIPGAVRTTAWLGGGTLVRTGSRSSILTTADPFDLSPPEAGETSRTSGPSKTSANAGTQSYASTTGYNTPSTKASLVRDRGETSLRKTALTRFPSDLSMPKGGEGSPLVRTASRSRLGEIVTMPESASAVPSGSTTPAPDLGLEGLSPAEKARRLKQLNKLSASEKREVYKGYKQGGGRYLPVDQVRRPATEGYEIDPSKNEGKSHQFHDVKRRKEDRQCMHGGDCEECRDWYEAIGPIPRFNQAPAFGVDTVDDDDEAEGIRRHQNMVSRHRETWVKPPTPPGFWKMGFPNTQEVEEQNKKADAMERQKEERLKKDAAAAKSKWRKKA